MALAGWLARRVLGVLIFAPLVGMWYGAFVYLIRLPPGFLGLKEEALEELVIASVVAAVLTDFLIVRGVKRFMKAREPEGGSG